MDAFTWEWALDNIQADDKEEADKIVMLIKTCIGALKPWMNYELYQAEEKVKRAPPTPSTTFIDELRKRGATDEELKGAIEEQERLTQLCDANPDGAAKTLLRDDSDDFDPEPTILR